ncbi:MAG: sigma 54-interacting transcriptional regulator [Candidatus Sedimenticola endophacoides]
MNNGSTRLLGNSPIFLRALHAARMVASTDAPVLIRGERGTGKELLAREIHAISLRRARPFETINGAGLGDRGLGERLATLAAGVGDAPATLFLDQVGELSAHAQGELLQFLERGDLRLITGSCEDLQAAVNGGGFRADLFYRLNIVPLEMPPLREREGDVVLLLKRFSTELAHRYNRRAPQYTVSARNLLKAYAWPGNVRELRNFCERMVILLAGQQVQPSNLPEEIRSGGRPGRGGNGFQLPEEGIDLLQLEGDMIRQALSLAGGNRAKASRLLRISRDTLLYRIQKHNIAV